MSIIAGKIAVQVGTHLLHQPEGGKGKLLGGLPSTERGKVVVFGAGKAGGASAALAAAGGSNVVVFEMRQDRMDEMMRLGNNVTALYPYVDVVAREVATADLGHRRGAGHRRPRAARADPRDAQGHGRRQRGGRHLDRPGRLLRNLASDHLEGADLRGGGRTHFCVTNMPGAVPQTSSQAICAAILPWVNKLAGATWRDNAGPGARHQRRGRQAGPPGAAGHEAVKFLRQ